MGAKIGYSYGIDSEGGMGLPTLLLNRELDENPATRAYLEHAWSSENANELARILRERAELVCERVLSGDDADDGSITHRIRALLRRGDVLGSIEVTGSFITAELVGPTPAACRDYMAWVRQQAPAIARTANSVYVKVWQYGQRGVTQNIMPVDPLDGAAVAANYSTPTLAGLDALRASQPPFNGRIIVWTGPPGTGKTHAIRTLFHAWRTFADFEYVMDPESLFRSVDYVGSVVTQPVSPNRWRVVVLEDAGELLSREAKQEYGPGLARFLNVTDGLLGGHSRVVFLVTTNEEIGRIHPAVARPGRCITHVDFAPLTGREAEAWRRERKLAASNTGATLAELYAEAAGVKPSQAAPQRVGFAGTAIATPQGEHDERQHD